MGPRQVQLRDLKFDHLDWKEMGPAYAHHSRSRDPSKAWVLQRVSMNASLEIVIPWKFNLQPCSSTQLTTFMSQLESIQKCSPELKVVIFGGIPKGRVAAFRSPLEEEPVNEQDFRYYIIPYPE